MKKIENTVVYQCEWCGKKSASAGGMKFHEKTCWQNPANKRMCFNCRNFHDKYPETDEEANAGRPFKLETNIKIDIRHEEFETGHAWFERIKKTVTPYNYVCKLENKPMLNPYKTGKDIVEGLVENGWTIMPTYNEGCPNFKKRETK